MFHTSVLELSQNSLNTNISFLRKLFGKKVRISSVVKGNAYGHGIEVFVPMAEKAGIDHFSVFSTEEAYRVASTLTKDSEIMIMGMIDDHDIEWAITEKIQFWVFDLARLESALKTAQRLNLPARIHLELETGFNRTGFQDKDFMKLISLLKNYEGNFAVEGMCTHYAGAESIANYYRIHQQIKKFNNYYKWFNEQGIHPALRHTACSAAAVSYPQTRMEMVRIGILQYGFWPSRETLISYLGRQEDKTDPLNRIISWKSRIMSVKSVSTGEFVGYGTSYLAQRDMKIGIVPVGYSQGFSRSMSNHGRALVKGCRVAVIGIVNMNHLIIDVTDVPGIKRNDEVVLIGCQGDLTISVSSFSELSDQLNYESLSRLPRNIPRYVI
ncbi:MAG TPA: alanine racemase [Ignavibacteriaceae bacterium]|nr:alanine racemase [Ignavibacteriaceae bacterium]